MTDAVCGTGHSDPSEASTFTSCVRLVCLFS